MFKLKGSLLGWDLLVFDHVPRNEKDKTARGGGGNLTVCTLSPLGRHYQISDIDNVGTGYVFGYTIDSRIHRPGPILHSP